VTPGSRGLADGCPRTPLVARSKVALALLSALPFAILATYVATHSVNAPWGEGWDYAQTVIIPAYDGTLSLGALYAQYMDHRIVVSKLLMVAYIYLTRWDVRTHSVVALIQAMVIFAFAVAMFSRGNRRGAWIVAVPFSMLIFAVNLATVWLRQYNDTLFPFVFLMIGTWTMTSGPPSWRNLMITAACASAATFSSLIGVLMWGAMLPGLWAAGYRKPKYFGAWAALFGLHVAVYSIGFHFSKLTQFGAPPADVVGFALALLGSAFARTVSISVAAVVVGLGLAAFDLYLLRRTLDFGRRVSGWVTLIVYGLVSAAATAAGRAHLGTWYAVQVPHYTLISVCLWIGIIALSVIALQELSSDPRRVPLAINLAVLVTLVPLYTWVNIEEASQFTRLGITYGPTPADEGCLRRTVITGEKDCFHARYWFGSYHTPVNYELARRRLGTFSRMEHLEAIAPPEYQPSDRIVVYAPLAAQHVPLTDGAGHRVPDRDILHIMADGQRELFLLDAPPDARAITAGALPASLAPFANGSSRIWYLATSDDPAAGSAIEGALHRQFAPATVQLDQADQHRLLYPVAKLFQPTP
jgi:hypothetical protein